MVAFLGSLAGSAYEFVVTGDLPGSIRARHLAHLQGVMIGIMILAVSSLVTQVNLEERTVWILSYCFVVTGYCYSLGPIAGAIVGVRGIEPVLPVGNLLMYVSNTLASLSVLLGLGLTIYGARKPARHQPEAPLCSDA